MLAISIAILILALLGHAALWVGVVNRWHGTGFSRLLVKSVTLLFYAALFGLPLLVARHWLQAEHGLDWLGHAWPPLDRGLRPTRRSVPPMAPCICRFGLPDVCGKCRQS